MVGVVGIGVDLCDVERMRTVLERTPTFARRTFTDQELTDAGDGVTRASSLAARFAAKEAVMKAMGLGLGAFGFHDAQTHRLESGAPILVLSGAAADHARARGITHWHVSLSHERSMAVAMVIAESNPSDENGS